MTSFQGKSSLLVSAFGLLCFVLAFCLFNAANFCAMEPALIAQSPADFTGQTRVEICDKSFSYYDNGLATFIIAILGAFAMFVAFVMKMNV